MPTYNFKRETKLYVVRNGLKHAIDIYPDLSFSQTFNETSVPVKTLHAQYDMYENAVITKANPANFSFTIPILQESDLDIVLELLRDYDSNSSEATLKTADLYIESNSEINKLEMAVVESGTFMIPQRGLLTLAISGTARKLSKFTGTIPGVAQARKLTQTYSWANVMRVSIAEIEQQYVTAVSVEMQNTVNWVDFSTLQNSLGVTNGASETVSFPEVFVVSGRTLSGTVQQYVTDETNTNVNTWNTATPISIQVGNKNTAWALEFNIPLAVYTNRSELQELLIQSYDFRMISPNPILADVVKKRSI